MADAAAPVQAKQAKKKAPAKPKKPAAHPKYSEMIKAAITALKERGGSSRQAILKYIVANYKVGDEKSCNPHLKLALKSGANKGTLKQVKGTGASGSFRLGDKAEKKPKAKKPTKPKAAAKKPKAKKPKAATKKASGEKKAAKKPKAKKPASKKPAAKKPAAKPKKAKSPKKASKPKVKKSTKKAAKKA